MSTEAGNHKAARPIAEGTIGIVRKIRPELEA